MALPGGGFGFLLDWEAFAPTWDPAWTWATAATRRRFRDEAARYASAAWKLHRARGLDRHGVPMKAIGVKTAIARAANVNRVTAQAPYSPMGRADAGHAPLQATGPNSRTQTLLRYRAAKGGIWFYWATDPFTGVNWGAVLDRHRKGFTHYFRYPEPPGFTRVPARDVFGFSPAELKAIEEHLGRWWLARRHAAANLRVEDLPEEGLSIPMPTGPAKVVAPGRRQFPPSPRPNYTVEVARVSAVSGSGGRELGAGTRVRDYGIGNKAPAWMRKAVR